MDIRKSCGTQKFGVGYRNTIFYTVVGTVIGLAVNIPAAYALSRHDLVGRKIITFFFIFTMFFNGGLIPTYFTIQDFGLLQQLLGDGAALLRGGLSYHHCQNLL